MPGTAAKIQQLGIDTHANIECHQTVCDDMQQGIPSPSLFIATITSRSCLFVPCPDIPTTVFHAQCQTPCLCPVRCGVRALFEPPMCRFASCAGFCLLAFHIQLYNRMCCTGQLHCWLRTGHCGQDAWLCTKCTHSTSELTRIGCLRLCKAYNCWYIRAGYKEAGLGREGDWGRGGPGTSMPCCMCVNSQDWGLTWFSQASTFKTHPFQLLSCAGFPWSTIITPLPGPLASLPILPKTTLTAVLTLGQNSDASQHAWQHHAHSQFH